MPRYRLLDMPKEKPKMLTVKFDLHTLAEFSATAELNRARSMSEYVHRFAVRQIEETKKRVDLKTFEEMYRRKLADMQERSAQKAKERKRARKGQQVVGAPVRKKDVA